MAKRFTDTDKWKKPYIRGLQGAYKLLWLYILDDCDHAGIWQVDLDVAALRIGEKLKLETALKNFHGKIYAFDDDSKWFIPSFIEFQYGELNPENRAHNSVIKILTKYNLDKDLTSPLQGATEGAMDKDMVKDKDMDTDKVKDKPLKIELIFPFDSQPFMSVWEILVKEKKWKGKSQMALQACLQQLSEVSEPDAIQMMKNTIAGEWQGLFPLKTNNNGRQQNGIGGQSPRDMASEASTLAKSLRNNG